MAGHGNKGKNAFLALLEALQLNSTIRISCVSKASAIQNTIPKDILGEPGDILETASIPGFISVSLRPARMARADLQVGQICLRLSHWKRQVPQKQWPQGTRLCAATMVSWQTAQLISSSSSFAQSPCNSMCGLTVCHQTEE